MALARFQHHYKKWERSQKKIKAARALIKSTVSPFIRWSIRNKDDPVEVCKFLKEKYEISDTAARQKLLNQLKNTTLNKVKYNVEDYVNKVFEIRENLQDYDKELEDNEIAKYILSGLPDSYNDFKRKYSCLM